jgi:hypothetical protein
MDIKSNIFISHGSKDETLAVELKTFLENIFLDSTVYVSGRDLQGGQTWIENIKLSLKSSKVIISIITKESINNNWIYFETGAGFTDDKSIPLITDGLKFSDLVPPLSLLQVRTLSKKGIESLVSDISNKLGLRRTPKMLTGIENLLDESEKFLKIRTKEILASKKEQSKVSEPKKVEISSSNKHSGWRHKDIVEIYNINKNSVFYAKITLNDIKQTFVIYIRVLTVDNRKYWIGFAGNTKNSSNKTKIEYTRDQIYSSKEVIIHENINSIFNTGFPELNTQPIQIVCIRLRGSDTDKREIFFEYKVI